MMTCDHVIGELGRYLDDQVAVDLHRQLEAHLARCRTCSAVYDSTRRTIKIVTEARSFDIPQTLSERIVKQVLAAIDARGRA